MKKRYLYALLFGIPGFFISGVICLFTLGAFFGFLWIYIFGDDPWPAWTETMISSLMLVIFLSLWIGSMVVGYRVGKGLEQNPLVNWNHVLASAGMTVLFSLFFVMQQWNVGNLGPQSDTVICSDFCARNGYAGSSMPPRDSGDTTCSCYDNSGNEVLKVPLDSIEPDDSK